LEKFTFASGERGAIGNRGRAGYSNAFRNACASNLRLRAQASMLSGNLLATPAEGPEFSDLAGESFLN
jgi:hypothetical protein